MTATRTRSAIVYLLIAIGFFSGMSPARACGYQKCEEPGTGSDNCWDCTFSLFFFQLCHYWCRQSASGAWHSTCWEESCTVALDHADGSAADSICQAESGISASAPGEDPEAIVATPFSPPTTGTSPATMVTLLAPRT
jgi:hypothetical protein